MDVIEKLKSINLIEHVQKYLGGGKKENNGYRFKSSKDDNDPSLLVYNDMTKGYNDFSGRLGGGTIIDFHMNYFKVDLKTAISQLCEMYGIQDDEKKEFKKSPKRYEFVINFEDYRLPGLTPELSRFLQTRGLKFDDITGEFKQSINEVAKEIGFCNNHFVDKDGNNGVYKDVIIFPCLDWQSQIIGAKIRRCDGEKIIMGSDHKKSIAVSKPPKEEYTGEIPFSTGLLFSEVSESYALIVEGETDYLILKILGYKSVIGNLGGVSSNATEIQQLVKNTQKIVCLYDNDGPGRKGAISLQEKIGRPIRVLEYPKIDGLDKYDINDLFKAGYRKKDFDALIQKSVLIDDEYIQESEKLEEQKLFKDRYFYNDTKMEYFDVKDFSFTSSYTLSRHMFIKPKELEALRQKKEIPTYEGICYLDGGKKGFYNLLDKSKMIQPSNTPELNEHIEFLIENLCNRDEINMEWIYRAILHKYTHLNDVYVPAVIFHGVGGTGKGLFVNLLEQIFGKNNTLSGLRQENIEGRFSAYTGQKLIVEFIELTVESFTKGKKNTSKLKSIVMEDTITIEKKGQDTISTENIAWFIMSSNESKPIQLDSVDTGNRRFSVIRTGKFIPREKGELIANAIKDKKNIENFLAYLFAMFPDVPKQKVILPLENQDKKDLEYLSESVGNLFFRWMEEKYPNINKITNDERKSLLDIYRAEIGEDDFTDERYRVQYFNSGLSVRYKPTVLQIRGKVVRGYSIDKKVNGDGDFPEGFFNIPVIKPKGIL